MGNANENEMLDQDMKRAVEWLRSWDYPIADTLLCYIDKTSRALSEEKRVLELEARVQELKMQLARKTDTHDADGKALLKEAKKTKELEARVAELEKAGKELVEANTRHFDTATANAERASTAETRLKETEALKRVWEECFNEAIESKNRLAGYLRGELKATRAVLYILSSCGSFSEELETLVKTFINTHSENSEES